MVAARHVEVEIVPIQVSDEVPAVTGWSSLREATANPTAYADLRFAVELARSFQYDLHACTARTDDDSLAGGVLCFTRGIGPYTRAVVPPFVQFTPLLLRDRPTEFEIHSGASVFQSMLEKLRDTFGATALNLQPEILDLRPAAWSGFRAHPYYTYRVDLGTSADTFHGWSESVQRQFRRATGDFQLVEGVEYTADVVALCAAGYGRHGRDLPAGAAAVEQLIRSLHARGMVDVLALTSESGDETVAGVAVLHDDTMAHYWVAGSRPGPAMTVLLGNMMQRLSARGIKVFDFVGANTPSIAEFKRRFGPRLISYHRIEHCRALGLRALDALRSRFRAIGR